MGPHTARWVWLWDTMGKWMSNMKLILADDAHAAVKSISAGQLDAEMGWMRQYLAQLKSPVVFCHNDLQEGNILIRESAHTREDRLVIIDFEYCSYNYRGFDVANHLCEWMYEYTLDKHPNFVANPSALPSFEQQVYTLG